MKILLIHASAGAGHQKAAEALDLAIKKYTAHTSVCIDSLDYTSPAFKKSYRDIYFYFISKMPGLWGFFFALIDQKWIQPVIRPLRRAYNHLNTRKLINFLMEERFDYIFSTHFMSTEVVSALKRSGRIDSKLVTIVTDYDVHHIWLGSHVDTYAVATTWTKDKLAAMGVPPERIVVTGIPTDERFALVHDRTVLKERIGLKKDVFTVLLATGSFGIGPIEEIIQAMSNQQVLVICGHNKGLYERLQEKKDPHVKAMGLVNNMYEMMAVSDCMVTKPGGLSISEALVAGLPLIFFNAIPGQETNNIKVLSTYGVGYESKGITDIVKEVNRLSASKDDYMTMLKKVRTVARPNAVKDLISLIK